jgi:hypothetical protein
MKPMQTKCLQDLCAGSLLVEAWVAREVLMFRFCKKRLLKRFNEKAILLSVICAVLDVALLFSHRVILYRAKGRALAFAFRRQPTGTPMFRSFLCRTERSRTKVWDAGMELTNCSLPGESEGFVQRY